MRPWGSQVRHRAGVGRRVCGASICPGDRISALALWVLEASCSWRVFFASTFS